MRRYFNMVGACAVVLVGCLATGAVRGAVVGKWTMEVDDLVGDLDPTGDMVSVPDTSGTGGSPLTGGRNVLAAPGANGTANGLDGFQFSAGNPNAINVNGSVASYEALNSASLRVSGYFRTAENDASFLSRVNVAGAQGFNLRSVATVIGVQFFVGGTEYVLNSDPAIDLNFGTNKAPAWTKLTFSYDATSGVGSLFENDQPRGSITAPGGGPMFVEGDVLNFLVGNGMDGGGGGNNAGAVVDEVMYESTAGGTTPTFAAADFDELGTVDKPDLTRLTTNFGKNPARCTPKAIATRTATWTATTS